MGRSRGWTGWIDQITPDQWLVYERLLRQITAEGITFALGGGIATAIHTGRWRDTNDMDIHILPADRQRLIDVTEQFGLTDVGDKHPYDHSWTYRATDGSVIVEAIWSMRNHLADIDREWFTRASRVDVRGMSLRVAAPEELIWPKLYVIMGERCDWPDVLNYYYYCGEGLDWQHLIGRVGDDTPLLAATLVLFAWISPDRISTIPSWVWQRLAVQQPETGSECDGLRRAALLSTRNWYGPMAEGSTLEKSK